MAALRCDDKDDEKNKKLTGRELFMRDKTLNESDLSFLGEGESEVTVDESLFQDLDDLDLEDVTTLMKIMYQEWKRNFQTS
ncbi:RWD domain-containing protein 1-like [Macrobrachium rosenbergii]|uniref:RWD domain-containing protein 1-like n=1 Tax=Macrobrachium rosenbergii TaxID=79674 RepID=UPI0034D75BE1